MSTSTNEIWLGGERLHLDDETQMLPSFQANDRTKPDTIQADYSPEFSVPGTAHNHRLLKHAAASQPVQGSAYVRVPCVLTSGGVETLPLALLYLKGYRAGRYQLQIAGGNRRLIEALGDKKLSDLDLNRFNHNWTPENVLAGLPVAHWQQKGWGYEVYDRGRPLDLQSLDPYTLYPSVSDRLVFYQILADAGFTADSLAAEPLFAALNVPAPNPYEFSQDFRDARQLTAGYFYLASSSEQNIYYHNEGFDQQRLNFSYISQKPYHQPDVGTATYFAGIYTAETLGYYDISAAIPTYFSCNDSGPGKVRVKFMLLVNGQHIFDREGAELGKDEAEGKGSTTKTFNPKLSRYLLYPQDKVELVWRGDEIGGIGGIGPGQPRWHIGPYGSQTDLGGGLSLANEVRFTVTLLSEFPPGGLVRLQDWLPEMKQLDYLKTRMLLGGLTIQTDQYEPHLRLATGAALLANIGRTRNWTTKRNAYGQSSRVPERELAFRFGSYGQVNNLVWTEDEHVTPGYGDGSIAVVDEVLPATNELAKLPFAATEPSKAVAGLLRILNFEATDLSTTPVTYQSIEAKPRLTLRRLDGELVGKLITMPQVKEPGQQGYQPAVLTDFATTVSYFADAVTSLILDDTVLTKYWADLRAMLDQSRYLTEYYRLTPQDIAELDFSVPIWDGGLGDYFAVSAVGEYDARRPVEVRLARINADHLPEPPVPNEAEGTEFYGGEFYSGEFY